MGKFPGIGNACFYQQVWKTIDLPEISEVLFVHGIILYSLVAFRIAAELSAYKRSTYPVNFFFAKTAKPTVKMLALVR